VEKKVTLKDVSERLNISQNTVSMALRDRPGIKRETKDKILEVAKELGYKTTKNNQETGNICIISTTDNLSDTYFYLKIQYAIESRVRASGHSLLLYNASSINTDRKELMVLFKKNHIKGVIILGDLDIDIARSILSCNIPIVTSGFYYFNQYTDCVIEENAAGTYKAVDHLLQYGYKSIGFIGNPKNCMGYLERYMGFMGAAQSFPLHVLQEWLITDFLPENEFDYLYMAAKLEAIKELPQAFICANDRVAMVVLKALHSLNKSVPDDIGLIGFDNSELAKMSIPALTTVDVNIGLQADALVRKLIKRIEGDESPLERVVIPLELVMGASLKYPPKEKL
jgi:LacI family transcriptional regulator